MPYIELESLPESEPVSGYRARFVHTGKMTLVYWRIDADAPLPEHAHPQEQVVNILEGRYRLTFGEETRILEPGDVVVIPPNQPHSGRSVTACRILDVFHPERRL